MYMCVCVCVCERERERERERYDKWQTLLLHVKVLKVLVTNPDY